MSCRLITCLLIAYLAVTGGLMLLVAAFPPLAWVGLILLVVPGAFLVTTPTGFLYGLAFALPWFLLRRRAGGWIAIAASIALVGAVATLPRTVINPWTLWQVEAARAGDRRPEGRLALSGILRIESENERAPYIPSERRHRYACADLCLAALLTPGIQGVVVGEPDHDGRRDVTSDTPTVLYRLVRAGGCANAERFGEYTFPFQGGGTVPGLRTRGTLALAAGACLVPSREIPAADWTIRYGRETLHDAPWSGTLVGRIDRSRLSLDRGADRRLQQSEVSYTLLAPWLWLRPTDWATSFDWARTRYTGEAAAGHFDPIGLLAETTDLALRPAAGPAVEPDRRSIAAILARALDDPGVTADAPALRLVGPYFDTFRDAKGDAHTFGPDDLALVLRLIADPRVARFHGLWRPIHALGPDAGVLRAPMVTRILGAAIPDGRWAAQDLGRDLGVMPAGTYAVPSPDEEQLLADPVRRRWAARLIERQTDRGAAAAPGLVRIIAQSYGRLRDDGRDRVTDGVVDALAARKALCQIGPAASPVLADLEAVLASGVIPAHSLRDWEWSFTLARLGKPVADLAKPERSRLTQDEFVRGIEFALRRADRCQ